MMEDLVRGLALLTPRLRDAEALADHAAMEVDVEIVELMNRLEDLKAKRMGVRAPHEHNMAELNNRIGMLNESILAAWDGDVRTVRYPEGLLKFRTTRTMTGTVMTEKTTVVLELNPVTSQTEST